VFRFRKIITLLKFIKNQCEILNGLYVLGDWHTDHHTLYQIQDFYVWLTVNPIVIIVNYQLGAQFLYFK
jgi:hypothetical protein